MVSVVPKTLYHGPIRFLDYIEPYISNRTLRQFGYLQIIPAAPLMPTDRTKRSRRSLDYRVTYHMDDRLWMTPAAHMLMSGYYAHRAIPPSACTSDYLDWYYTRSHPFIQNPENVDMPDAEVQQEEGAEGEEADRSSLMRIYEVAAALYPAMPRFNQDIVPGLPMSDCVYAALQHAEDLLAPIVEQRRLQDVAEPEQRRGRRRGRH